MSRKQYDQAIATRDRERSDEAPDLVAVRKQGRDEATADEAGRSRNGRPHLGTSSP